MARAHIAGGHAKEPVAKCALCPACTTCGGKGAVGTGSLMAGGGGNIRCHPCGGTGSQKGGRG